MIFFTKNPNLKKKDFLGGRGGAEGGTRVYDIFTKSPNLKKNIIFFSFFFLGVGVTRVSNFFLQRIQI